MLSSGEGKFVRWLNKAGSTPRCIVATEYSEFIQQGVIDEARIARPVAVDRILGMVGIRDDCRTDTDLRVWVFGHPI